MNVLILTCLYPAHDLEKENTPVVHYFTRQWIKLGHNVRVIHYPTNFPKVYMLFGKLFKKRLSSKLGVPVRTYQAKEMTYELDGVKIKRIPLLKYKLHSAFSKSQIDKAYQKTSTFLQNDDFKPDCIVSHWVNPQLEIMLRLKQDFNVPTCYVAHTPTVEFTRIYDDEATKQIIENIDLIGFRSQYIKDMFNERFGYRGPTFQCYSGIPDQYIPKESVNRTFETIKKFVFVGTLIKRKFPAEIIPAVVKAYDASDFEINYIGKGAEEVTVKNYAKNLCVADKVHILGRMNRDEVIRHLQESDVFVMISRSEAFGLVYLEAMAQGCITIASRKEGFDGIIQDGVNGFLCNAGDIEDLAKTIHRIKVMPKEVLRNISQRAVETARMLTDAKVAAMYLDELGKMICNYEKHER